VFLLFLSHCCIWNWSNFRGGKTQFWNIQKRNFETKILI